MKKLLQLISYLKPYWKESVLSMVLLIATVFMDLAIPRLVQQIIDVGIAKADMQAVISTSLLMLGISILGTLFSIGNNTLSVKAGEGFARDLRDDLFQKIQRLSYGNVDRMKTGNLIVRLTSDIQVLQQAYQMSLRMGIRAPLMMIGSIILMFSTDASLSLRILPVLLLTGLAIGILIAKMGPVFMIIQKKLDILNTVLQENIAGVRVVKAFVRQNHEEERFETANQDFTEVNIKILRIVSAIFPGLMLLVSLGTVIVIWFGGKQVIDGSLTIGQIVAFTNYLSTTLVPLMIMGMLASVIASGIASAERVDEVLYESPEIQEKPGSAKLPEKILGRVEFDHVGFYYNGNCEEKVLDGINLKVEPGQTVAILGATGSGKSTLVNLIPRFYEISEGKILIDGKDIREVEQDSLLANIAITPQETVLFSGTVRDNIAYGCPDASMEEVIEVAKAAQAHDFIMGLPEKYNTSISARGVNLSGGQKQRIAIARAILLKPAILILDDSTSSVDVETEIKIQNALKGMVKETTIFMVAQRISTVLTADKIVVIEKGKIAAEGNHQELMRTSKIYKEIYDSQLGDGDNFKSVGIGRQVLSGAK
ncbi:MAG: ABC transporter ATP-binding protein/permease [Anaerolineaceae bacterium]|nr:ABC transporter ATP-binding protein/permease [Anaerolineaceae bacterium]